MSYIGTPPSNAFTSLLKQDFSTSATTGYTLDHAVNNANDIALFINFVRQEPTAGYAASNTSLVLTSATASSDDMYCVYLGQALQTVNPANASVGSSQLSPIAITGQTAEATIATDDTILIHDTSASALRKMTRANFVSGIGGTNTPAFLAYLGSSQSIGTSQTKVNMNSEVYDTDGKYDTSSYRFTPTIAGKYFVFVQYRIEAPGTNDSQVIKLFENGGEVVKGEFNSATNRDHTVQLSTVRVLDDNDYLEVYSYNSNTKTLNPGQGNTFWGAYKIIE